MIETFRNKDDGSNSQKHDDSKQRVGRLEDILAAGTEQEGVQDQQAEYIQNAVKQQQKSLVVDKENYETE
ncbi:MAG: hypothetical protein IJV62_01375, partial [Eggerthellaceae bacterium]|nr:hypothetical protein [Eggerthellaceae bacterium]